MSTQLILDIIAHDTAETEATGEYFADLLTGATPAETRPHPKKQVPGAVFLAMYGDLGAGKTTFIRGMAHKLTPEAEVSSPTYALVHEYHNVQTGVVLYHFDMYRITDEDDLYSIGFYDYFDQNDRRFPFRILAAEWSENIPYALPEQYYRIQIEKLPDGRHIKIFSVADYTENQ